MIFDSKLYLKWIDINRTEDANFEANLINLCVFAARDLENNVVGFTAFEAHSLNSKFFERFHRRLTATEFKDKDLIYTLYLPKNLKSQLDALISSLGLKQFEVCYTSFVHIKRMQSRFLLRSRVRVINVDDSPSLLKFLEHSMKNLEFVDVVAQVSDPKKAVEIIERMNPDLITMDIQMPNLTGVSVVKELLEKKFYRIIMISSLTLEEGSLVFDALNAGACDYIQKPKFEEKEFFDEELKNKMLVALNYRKLQRIKIVKPKILNILKKMPDNLIWCLGASTGGTKALTDIFTSLPNGIPATLVVQHIPPVFSKAFAESLNLLCPFTVKEAEQGEALLPNHVYIAPGGLQMRLHSEHGKLSIKLADSEPVNRFKPSIDYLFCELAELKNLRFVAALLTGMGKDGAEGLLKLRKAGAITMAQDEQSSAVYGMPRQAYEIGAAQKIISLDDMAHEFLEISAALK